MTKREILDQILLGLADQFEAGKGHVRTYAPSCAQDYEPLRECVAELVAEGSLADFRKTNSYSLTPAGYLKYKPRIDALRVMPR